MVLTNLKSICKRSRNVGISILVAIAPLLTALDASIDALLVFPQRLPIQNLMGTSFINSFPETSKKTNFLEVSSIDLDGSLFSFSIDVSGDQIELSLLPENQSIAYQDKEFFCFDLTNNLPLEEIVATSLIEPVCKKKHIFQNESYPDFTPFGQLWSKNPLGFFSYYKEQLATNYLMNPDKWTIQDSSISAFLQSSILRLERALDEKALSSTPLIEKSEYVDSLLIAAETISDLQQEYALKSNINFYETTTHLISPLLADASSLDGTNVFTDKNFKNQVNAIDLPFAFENQSAWKENFIAEFLSAQANFVTGALFHSIPKTSFLISEQFKTLYPDKEKLALELGSTEKSAPKDIAFETEKKESFQISSLCATNPFSPIFTFAGVYTDDFFAPVGKIAKKTWIQSPTFVDQEAAPSPFPLQQKNSSTLVVIDVIDTIDLLPSNEDSNAKHFIGNELARSTTSLVPTFFGDLTSPFYSKSYLTRSDQKKLHPVLANWKPFHTSYAYIRYPHLQSFKDNLATSIAHQDLLSDFKLVKLLPLNSKFEIQNELALSFTAQDSTYFQGSKFDEIYTSSFLKDDIQLSDSRKKIHKIKLLNKKTPLIFFPDPVIARFDIAYEDDLQLPELVCGQIDDISLELSILDVNQNHFFSEYRSEIKHLELRKPVLATFQACPDLRTTKLDNCQTQEVNKPDYSMFVRNLKHGQENELLSYQALVKDSVPKGYYFLPHLNLTGPILLPFGIDKPELIETIGLATRACNREMAKGKNKDERLTHLELLKIPSLEFLNTDSLENEFKVLVRTTPKKTGDGHLFSALITPNNTDEIEKAPHHIYFVMDRSSSLEEHRFNTFKKALSYSVAALDDGDRFNIALFDYEYNWLSEKDFSASKRTLKHVKKLLENTSQRGKSNILTFTNLVEQIKCKAKASGEPHTIVLLTDGRFMKNIRLQRHSISYITENFPENLSLFAASASDNNNLGMINLLTNLCRGDAVHAKTHSAYARKLASLTKRVHKSIGYGTKVTQISGTDGSTVFELKKPKQIYAGKAFKVYGETKDQNDINLLVQTYSGNKFINIPQKISFKNAEYSASRLEKDLVLETTLPDLVRYIQSGRNEYLLKANSELASQNFPLPTR